MFITVPINKTGPIIRICNIKKTNPLEKLGFILFKLTLSDVWERVTQLLLAFQIMFGKTTIKIVIKKIINFDLFEYKTLLKRLSKNRRTMREIKK